MKRWNTWNKKGSGWCCLVMVEEDVKSVASRSRASLSTQGGDGVLRGH